MGEEDENDYDRISKNINDIIKNILINSYNNDNSEDNTIVLTHDTFINLIIKLQRLSNYTNGLANAQRKYNTVVFTK